MLLRLIRSNGFGLLNRTLVMVNLIPSRFEYFSRMGLSCKAFNDSTRNFEMVYLVTNRSHERFKLIRFWLHAAVPNS